MDTAVTTLQGPTGILLFVLLHHMFHVSMMWVFPARYVRDTSLPDIIVDRG